MVLLRFFHVSVCISFVFLCFVVGGSEAAAQAVEVLPSAVVSTVATSNRDFLPRGQENAQWQLRGTGTLGLVSRGEGWLALGEYQLLLIQPLLTLSEVATEEELDRALRPESLHGLRGSVLWSASERWTLGGELEFQAGERTPLAVSPVPLVEGEESVTQAAGVDVLVQRNRYVQAGGALRGEGRLGERDRLELRLGGSWRRNYTPTILAGGDEATRLLAESQERFRDTSTLSARLGWWRDWSERWSWGLEGQSDRALNDLSADSTTFAGRVRGRWRGGERFEVGGFAGALLFVPDEDDEDLVGVALEEELSWSSQLGLSASFLLEGWTLGLSLGRDVINAGALGSSLEVDAGSVEVVYFQERDLALRGTASSALSRPLAVREGDPEVTIWSVGGGVGAVWHLMGWLNLDASYNLNLQQGLGDDGAQGALAGLGAPGQDVVVHTVFVGLSARASLNPSGRAVLGELR